MKATTLRVAKFSICHLGLIRLKKVHINQLNQIQVGTYALLFAANARKYRHWCVYTFCILGQWCHVFCLEVRWEKDKTFVQQAIAMVQYYHLSKYIKRSRSRRSKNLGGNGNEKGPNEGEINTCNSVGKVATRHPMNTWLKLLVPLVCQAGRIFPE